MSLHIAVHGSGPPLVLLHGWALHGGVFDPLVERLSDRFELHVVDLPGHGRSRDSTVPLRLQACVDAICEATPPAAWLGWSLGGLFALKAAAASGQVRALAMVSSVPRFTTAPDWPHAVAPAVFAQFGVDLAQDYRGTLERFLALDLQHGPQGRAELRALREMLYAHGEPTPAALQAGLALLEHTDLRHTLPGLAWTCPRCGSPARATGWCTRRAWPPPPRWRRDPPSSRSPVVAMRHSWRTWTRSRPRWCRS